MDINEIVDNLLLTEEPWVVTIGDQNDPVNKVEVDASGFFNAKHKALMKMKTSSDRRKYHKYNQLDQVNAEPIKSATPSKRVVNWDAVERGKECPACGSKFVTTAPEDSDTKYCTSCHRRW